jgi:hypothetical protein
MLQKLTYARMQLVHKAFFYTRDYNNRCARCCKHPTSKKVLIYTCCIIVVYLTSSCVNWAHFTRVLNWPTHAKKSPIYTRTS